MSSNVPIVKPQPMSGFPDWLPGERMAELRLLDKIRQSFELFGFSPIETPAVERLDILAAKGEIAAQIYRLFHPQDGGWGETEYALHTDLTIPLARYVAQYYHQLVFPFRRYQIQKVWRGERRQKGRSREFYQCDIDIVGDEDLSLMADAEIPCVIYEVFKQLEIGAFQIHLNNRKLLQGLLFGLGVQEDQILGTLSAIDDLRKVGRQGVERELRDKVGLTPGIGSRLLSLIETQGRGAEMIRFLESQPFTNDTYQQGLSEIRKVIEYLEMFHLPEEAYVTDLSIARGLDYYTGTVYETMLQQFPNYGSVCSGGRYDDLASRFIKKRLPGVGISIGLTRLFEYLKDEKVIQVGSQTPAKVLVTTQDRALLTQYLELTSFLRSQNVPTEIYLEQKELTGQMKYANRKGIPLVIVARQEEAEQNEWVLRNMRTGTEQRVPRENLPGRIVTELQGTD